MKESFFIDMYAAKNGVMNPRDRTKGDLLEYNYPHSKQNMKLQFPVRMQFYRLNFTIWCFSHFRINKHWHN